MAAGVNRSLDLSALLRLTATSQYKVTLQDPSQFAAVVACAADALEESPSEHREPLGLMAGAPRAKLQELTQQAAAERGAAAVGSGNTLSVQGMSALIDQALTTVRDIEHDPFLVQVGLLSGQSIVKPLMRGWLSQIMERLADPASSGKTKGASRKGRRGKMRRGGNQKGSGGRAGSVGSGDASGGDANGDGSAGDAGDGSDFQVSALQHLISKAVKDGSIHELLLAAKVYGPGGTSALCI